jgi:hypothetical protein
MLNHKLKSLVLEAVSNSKSLREKLPLSEHLKLYKWVSDLKEDQLTNYILETPNGHRFIPNYGIQKVLDLGLAAAILSPIPGSEVVFLAIKHIEENFNKKCLKNCKDIKRDKKVCYWSCHYKSVLKVREIIEQEFKKCKYHPIAKEKEKCFKKLGYLLVKWKEREIKLKNKVEAAQRQYLAKRLRR